MSKVKLGTNSCVYKVISAAKVFSLIQDLNTLNQRPFAASDMNLFR
jgi:hypothetical protein